MNCRHVIFIALCVALVNTAQSQQTSFGDKEAHAMCAAANALLTTQMESGMLTDLIKAEAKRHADAARRLGASQRDLEQVVAAMGAAYNQKKISWEEIADLGQQCTDI